MRPKRIILVRHGESQGNVNKEIYAHTPDHSLELTEKGVVQAKIAGEQIRKIVGNESVHFWVSPYRRTRMTFDQIVIAFDLSQIYAAYESWDCREQDWGNFREAEATKMLERQRDDYGAIFFRFPNGESVADVWNRQAQFIDSLWRDFSDPDYVADNVCIVGHGRTMRAFAARWFHWSHHYSEVLRNPGNCDIWVMDRTDVNRPSYKMTTKILTHDESVVSHESLLEMRLSMEKAE